MHVMAYLFTASKKVEEMLIMLVERDKQEKQRGFTCEEVCDEVNI